MRNWYSSIYIACLYASLFCFVIGFFSTSQTALGAYIAGYSVLILSIMMILIILFNNILKTPSNVISNILMNAGPFILVLGVISFMLYLLIKYFNEIKLGHVSPSFNSFSNIIVMLIFLQVYLIYNNIDSHSFDVSGKISKVTSSLIYLLLVLTMICSVNIYIILKYFTTDGFRSLKM